MPLDSIARRTVPQLDSGTCLFRAHLCAYAFILSVCTDTRLCVWVFVQEKAISIWESRDFFIELEPLPGGVEAVKEMAKMDK